MTILRRMRSIAARIRAQHAHMEPVSDPIPYVDEDVRDADVFGNWSPDELAHIRAVDRHMALASRVRAAWRAGDITDDEKWSMLAELAKNRGY